jgi:transcriptional regulator with XRE-family HTH domain
MEQETEKILENLRKKRVEKKISLVNLALMIDISRSHLYYIESKRVIPSVDVFVKIAKALKTDMKDLLP